MSVTRQTLSSHPITLPESLAFLIHTLREQQPTDPEAVVQLIRDTAITPGDLEPWAAFCHAAGDSYGRKLVHQDDNFEIMVMSWRPGDFSAIHDHGQAEWGAVQIFGPAEHAIFRIQGEVLSTSERRIVTPGEILPVCSSLIHQMGNPAEDVFFLSLHVYGVTAGADHITAGARIFDLQHNRIQRVDGGVFFALPESAINTIEPGPRGDFGTRIRYLAELIRRLKTMQQAGYPVEMELKAAIADVGSFSPPESQPYLLRQRSGADLREIYTPIPDLLKSGPRAVAYTG